MKKFRKLSSVLMAALLLFAMVTPAGSVGVDLDETIHTGGMNDLNVRQAARDYMDTRAAYLLGETETMDWLITGIADDEAVHLDIYREAGITVIESEYDIVTVECYDNESYATVNETIVYSINGATDTELIVHEMTVICSNSATVVISDRYAESFSSFESCSYVAPMPDSSMSATTNQGGSDSCIVAVALAEVGTTETGDNSTKYGEWYGNNGNDWCATFVSWCAYTANIDISIIAKNADCDGQMNFFRNCNRFYFAPRYGSTYTPQAGDIIVFGVYEDAEKDADHVGIVEKVENGKVYTIEGNASNRVRYKNYALDDTKIIGYGNPDYETSDHIYGKYYDTGDMHKWGCINCGKAAHEDPHNYPAYSKDGTKHWRTCTICNITQEESHDYHYEYLNSSNHRAVCVDCMHLGSTAAHLYYDNYDEISHWEECISCGHQKNITAHSNSGYMRNGTHHWYECVDCSVWYATSMHTYQIMADGRRRCKVCGYIIGGIEGGTITSFVNSDDES